MGDAKVRLYVDQPLGAGQSVAVTRDQAHYLFGVMRLPVGGAVALFNGRDGEWQSEVSEAGKRSGTLVCRTLSAQQSTPPDLWLLFAPIKKSRTDFIVEKATEMGARRICPVQTAFTNAERIRRDRLAAHAVEAAEQCGGTFVPDVDDLVKLDRLLSDWPGDRQILFCDESHTGGGASSFDKYSGGLAARAGAEPPRQTAPWAILIGPEGGFSDTERTRLHAMENVHTVSLGPRILRADTAAVAAMTLWQLELGDWR